MINKIIVKLNGEEISRAVGSPETLKEWRESSVFPEGSVFEEIDPVAEFEAKKAKEEKRAKALKDLEKLEPAKGTTVASLKAEFNQLLELVKELHR